MNARHPLTRIEQCEAQIELATERDDKEALRHWCSHLAILGMDASEAVSDNAED